MLKRIAKITSLLRVEERLLEADFFVRLMKSAKDREEFGYCLNAFVSASRSVTFLLQKEMSKVPDFDVWWSAQQEMLSKDNAARFFLKMRNYSQKEGRINLVGMRIRSGKRIRWSYRFAGNVEKVPAELWQRDVGDCCSEHVIKLAKLTLTCADQFPFHSCPHRLFTEEGIQALQISLSDLGSLLGYSRDWIVAGAVIPLDHQLRILREQIDGVNFAALRRLSQKKVKRDVIDPTADNQLGHRLATVLVDKLEGQEGLNIYDLMASILIEETPRKKDSES